MHRARPGLDAGRVGRSSLRPASLWWGHYLINYFPFKPMAPRKIPRTSSGELRKNRSWNNRPLRGRCMAAGDTASCIKNIHEFMGVLKPCGVPESVRQSSEDRGSILKMQDLLLTPSFNRGKPAEFCYVNMLSRRM